MTNFTVAVSTYKILWLNNTILLIQLLIQLLLINKYTSVALHAALSLTPNAHLCHCR